jgi:subtilisin family serine protease
MNRASRWLSLVLLLLPTLAPAQDGAENGEPTEDDAAFHTECLFGLPPGEVGILPFPWFPGVSTNAEPTYDASGGTLVDVTGAPERVRFAVAPYGRVVVDVKRLEGDAPSVDALFDGTGVRLPAISRRETRKRVRLRPAAVGPLGGIEVVVSGASGGSGLYRVTVRAVAGSVPAPPAELETLVAPRRLVVPTPNGLDLGVALAGTGVVVVDLFDGFAVLDTGAGREGYEFEDARWLAALLPYGCGVEIDPIATTPDGSQANGVVVGSEFGRSYPRQQALRAIRAPFAHRRHRGDGVLIAVLDTGIDAGHQVFEGRLVPGFDFVDGDEEPTEEKDGVDDDGDGEIDEGFGHGTMVAGVALAAAPEATILPIRVLDTDGRGSASRVAAGVLHAVERDADVINLSLGMPVYSRTLADAIRYALERGVLVVAAAGNRGDRRKVDFPVGEPGVLSVTALGRGDRRTRFGNGGRGTTIAAPGVGIIGPYPGRTWARASGTSFSTALVSGGAALLREARPGTPPEKAAAALSSRWKLNLRRLTR